MFNHYHYWPDPAAHWRQEEALKQARLASLLRPGRPARPDWAAQLARWLGRMWRRARLGDWVQEQFYRPVPAERLKWRQH